MIKNKKIFLGIALIFVIFFLNFISAESIFNVQSSQFNQEETKSFDTSLCQEGKDFLLQVTPFGCEPAVVRTDLLEENDVQVYCQLGATQINPLIDVETIDSISFSGSYPKEVSGIGFHPAKAALGVNGDLNSPILNNIGYVTINLRKQSNASAIPDFVEGNLTAKVKYNIKNAIGIGTASIYLPELNQEDWVAKNYKYSFWNGKGKLRAESVEIDNAQIAVYSDEQKISSTHLKVGETSNMIYLPGLECQAGLKLKLESLDAPETRAILKINSEVVEIAEKEKFLDNKCSVRDIEYNGINQKVSLKCIEDSKTSEFDLSISPKITLNINGVTNDYSVGDWLYDTTNSLDLLNPQRSVYLGYAGTIKDSRNANDLFVYFVSMPYQKKIQLSKEELGATSDIVNLLNKAGITATGVIDTADLIARGFGGAGIMAERWIARGEEYDILKTLNGEKIIFGNKISIINFAGAQDIAITGDGIEYYTGAKEDYETVEESYPAETYDEKSALTFGEEASYKKILFMWNAQQRKTAYDLCQEFIRTYPNTKKDLSYCTDSIKLANQNVQEVYVTINGEVKTISFEGINEPSFNDYGVTVRLNTPEGVIKTFDLRKNAIVYLDKNQEIFSVVSGVTNVYFKYSDGMWLWSSNKQSWSSSLDTNSFPQLIVQLHGKTLENGKTLLKNQGAKSEILSVNDYLQLISADENSAKIKTSLKIYGAVETVVKEFSGGEILLTKDDPKDLGTGYIFTLTEINLKKSAKVSVIPNINNAGTEANFSFKIGIEKRAINLPPEQTRQIITTLDSTMGTWGNISNVLGNVTQGLQTACLATGSLLVAKNFLFSLTGSGVARQTVMRGSDGWTEKCADMVAKKEYVSSDACYLANAKKIDADVASLSSLIETQNKEIKNLESGITKQQFLSDSIVNTSAFMQRYTQQVTDCLGDQNFVNSDGRGEVINQNSLGLSYELWETNKHFDQEQLRNIELYCKILKSSTTSEELKQIANERIYSEMSDIKVNSVNLLKIDTLAKDFGISAEDVTFVEVGKNVKKFSYTGLENRGRISGVANNAPIAIVSTSSGQRYIFLLDDSSGTKQLPVLAVYKTSGEIIMDYTNPSQSPASQTEGAVIKSELPVELQNIYFQKFDATTYQNSYKNALLRYYETAPYKGLPAIVPFDLKNGWYAATKQTIPVSGNIESYEESGQVSSFYLCNIGEDGLESFQTIGDDICEMVNLGTGMPYNQFPGLDEKEAKSQVDKAVQAITQASNIPSTGRSGVVSILGNKIKIGSPAADIPQFQCQDIMSPSECVLLFNLCDPVICPSSRCDLGGTYPVEDVLQTGVIGSLALCLPNIQEGIFIPVCLTGVKAGIDGFVSTLSAYRSCLQESLDTGKVVGICDEIYSVYLCDFFWRQALPLTDIIIPKAVELLLGQNTRGGGEYASVENAWSMAETSINYFTNYYGANAKEAFLARATETVKSEVCKSYVSAVVPTGAEFISQITTPASPVQFTGNFDEIPLTTATVPATSHYKVHYRIFAGKDSGAYYKVYLKGDFESSYYQETSNDLVVASGYIPVGESAVDTPDLTAVSGYQQLCINVNGQEECGFKEVSTDFAINYIKDKYLASQASEADITETSACISGTPSVYSLLDSNIQSGAEELINPEIYNQGIIRICATDNPGIGTDTSTYIPTTITGNVASIDDTTVEETPVETDTENIPSETTEIMTDDEIIENLTNNPGVNDGPRWVKVGYCDNEKIGCWLDTQSVKDVIKTTSVEGDALAEVSQKYIDIIKNEGNYITESEFSSKIKEIENEKSSARRITLVDNILDRVFWNSEKARLLILRGDAYVELLINFIKSMPKPESTATTDLSAETTDLTDAQKKILDTAKELERGIIPSGWNRLCRTAVDYVFKIAKVGRSAVYADPKGTSYTLSNGRTLTIGVDKRLSGDPVWYAQPQLKNPNVSKEEKLAKLKPGYEVVYVWSAAADVSKQTASNWEDYDHMAIFIKWTNYEEKKALLFDWNGHNCIKNNKLILGTTKGTYSDITNSECRDLGGSLVWGIAQGEYDSNNVQCVAKDLYVNKDKREIPFCATFRYYEIDLSDDAHPVYGYWEPTTGSAVPTQSSDNNEDATLKILEEDVQESTGTSFETEQPSEKMTIVSSASTFLDVRVSPVQFVVDSLNQVGITSAELKSVTSAKNPVTALSLILDTDSNFKEVALGEAKAGDIIFFGEGCKIPFTVGILNKSISDKGDIAFYGNRNNALGIKIEKQDALDFLVRVETATLSLDDKTWNTRYVYPRSYQMKYPYRAYRYVGDLSEDEKKAVWIDRFRWTEDSAYSKVLSLTGDYNENEEFVKQLTEDGIINSEECGAGGGFSAVKTMLTLRSILENKKEIAPSSVIGEKIYEEAIKLEGTLGTPLKFVNSVLVNSGIYLTSPTSQPSSVESLIQSLDSNPNFVKMNTFDFRKGDILLIGKGCDKNLIGIFADKEGTLMDFEASYYIGSTKSSGKVSKLKTSSAYNIDSSNYIYGAYRYIGDLSEKEKLEVPKVTEWTLSSALSGIANLKGSYADNRFFIDSLFFDGVLTKENCEKIGIFNFGGWGTKNIKDITLMLEESNSE